MAFERAEQFAGVAVRRQTLRQSMNLCAKQSIEQYVAVMTKIIIAAHRRRSQNKLAGQAVAGRDGGGQPGVIGLKTAPGNQCVGAFGQCFAKQEFKFAQFVTTTAKAHQVIAFDVQIAAMQLGGPAQAGQLLNRCRAFQQRHSRVSSQRSFQLIQVVRHDGSLDVDERKWGGHFTKAPAKWLITGIAVKSLCQAGADSRATCLRICSYSLTDSDPDTNWRPFSTMAGTELIPRSR